MGFGAAVATCFRNYVTFSGRARRPEYWWFFLFLVAGGIVAGILDGILFDAASFQTAAGQGEVGFSAEFSAESQGPVAALFSLATFLPALAAGWRRMHDTGRSGLYLLYPLIAGVGVVAFLGFGQRVGVLSGGESELFTGTFDLVLVLALIVLALSPLLVLWWLTRPTQPSANEYGPEPPA
jgi:uncharacterized membrane protein YhaH (DUF805 family)